MLFEQYLLQIWSWSMFDLTNSFRIYSPGPNGSGASGAGPYGPAP